MSVAALDHWADILIEQHAEGSLGASIIRLVSSDASSDVELSVLPIGRSHPLDFLDGFRAPRTWRAIGVATGGWAAPMDGTHERPSAHPEARRVFQVVLVDRDGTVVGRMRYPDGTTITEPPGFGAVLDALRAAIGIRATPSPATRESRDQRPGRRTRR